VTDTDPTDPIPGGLAATWDVRFRIDDDGVLTWTTTSIEGNFASVLSLGTHLAAVLGVPQS